MGLRQLGSVWSRFQTSDTDFVPVFNGGLSVKARAISGRRGAGFLRGNPFWSLKGSQEEANHAPPTL